MKLRSKITGYLLPLILVPILLMALAGYFFVVRTYEARDRNQVESRLHASIGQIRLKTKELQDRLGMIASAPAVASLLDQNSEFTSADRRSLERFLESVLSQDAHILGISIMNSDGVEVLKTSNSLNLEKRFLDSRTEVFRRSQIVGFSQAPVFETEDRRSVFMIGTSVGIEDFIGVVVITIDTRIFHGSLRSQLRDGISIGFLDERGLVWTELGDKRIVAKSLLMNVGEGGDDRIAINSFQNRLQELDGAEYIVSLLPVLGYKRAGMMQPQVGERWYLLVVEPVLSPPGFGLFQVLFGVILLFSSIAVIWISTLTARRITRPIENVSRATAAIAKGNHNLDLNVNTGDEVEDLARAVSDMNRDLQKYQEQLVESTRLVAMGEMTSEISHEIQNRISGISLWLQHLDSEVSEGDERREYIEEMKLGLAGFYDMLAGLKEYYRKPALEISEFELSPFIRETVSYTEEKAKQEGVRVTCGSLTGPKTVAADREKLQSVVLNLLINGIEASAKDGKVRISTQTSGNDLLLTVEDAGPGIPNTELHKVFFPFYTTKSSGSGLGLAISKNIVAAHGGGIKIRNGGKCGATFEVRIPLGSDLWQTSS